ncbi:MAG: hypothetical protein ACLFPS_09490 [Clostridia bacterium]
MPKRTIVVEEEEQFFYCSKCENSNLAEDDFYTFNNDSAIYKSGFRPYCKECVKDLFWHYYEKYSNHENREIRVCMALDRMCQILDIPFSFRIADPAISLVKREAAEKNVPLDSLLLVPYTAKYMQLLNGAHRKGLSRKNYESETKDRMDLYIEYFKIKAYIRNTEAEEVAGVEFEEDVPTFLRNGKYMENVKKEATALYYYLKKVITDQNVINKTYTQMAVLEYANWLESIYNTQIEANATQISNIRDKARASFENALSELELNPKSIKLEEDANKIIGMKIKNLERTGPADWYAQPDKAERIINLIELYRSDDYIMKYIIRSMKNYENGAADYTGLNYEDFNAVTDEEKEYVDILVNNYHDISAQTEGDTDVSSTRSEEE